MPKSINELTTATALIDTDKLLVRQGTTDKQVSIQTMKTLKSDTSGTADTANAVRGINFHADAVDPTGTSRLNMDGYFYATRVYNAVYNDLAEYMDAEEPATAGQVLVMGKEGLKPSNKRADKCVIGVYSDTYGYALGAEGKEGKHPVGISGRVEVMVKEPLSRGDLLISDIGGFASKATTEEEMAAGIVIGKVMKDKMDDSVERVSMLIMNR